MSRRFDPGRWDSTYRERGDDVSWFEPVPTTSLEMIRDLPVALTAPIVDVGGGASTLVDHLWAEGHSDLTVLDLSRVALDRAAERLGTDAPVERICADVTSWRPDRSYGCWHDRAAFHFLTDEDSRGRYLAVLRRAVPRGWAIMATFAPDGPDSCSGLPVARYSADQLAEQLDGFEVVGSQQHVHATPWGAQQPFTYVVARRA